ncbi:MAG: DUF6017 domain-containing protein, partial [Oscillospiraceae bacterium]
NFTVMSNTHLKDRRLSYKAKGLLSVILSLPPDWDYTITGLAVIAADGVDSVKTAVKELEQYGYITRAQLRDERGRMAQNEYRVYENPADNPDSVQHEQASPEQVSPEQVPPEQDAPDEKPSRSLSRKRSSFSVSPSAENPSTVAPTADKTQADNIIKLNKNISNTDKSIHSFSPADRTELIDKGKKISFSSAAERKLYSEIIRKNICYDEKYAHSIGDSQQVDELISIMTDVVCSSSPTVRVNGEAVSREVVKSRFLKLTDEEIDYVLHALHNNSKRIANMRSYLITTLYNSKSTVSNYYANMAYNDIREGVV